MPIGKVSLVTGCGSVAVGVTPFKAPWYKCKSEPHTTQTPVSALLEAGEHPTYFRTYTVTSISD